MPKSKDVFEWNVKELAKAMKIKQKDVRSYFKDGRRVSFILERRLAYEVLHGKLAPSEGEDYDLTDMNGGKWEVRSITKGGVYFCPSYMVGKGRKFDLRGFLAKLNQIDGYILNDVMEFPKIPFWIIPKENVLKWWKEGNLGKNSSISRKKALKLIKTVKED